MTEPLPPFELPDPDFGEPEFAPWDGRRVPVTLLGGYLGAGKTTLLNALLTNTDRRIAVLVNEVGSINLDAALIRNRNGDTIELTDGCICCDLKNGLTAAFDEIRSLEIPPDHVVIELSGVAMPNRILAWANSSGFRLDGVVVLVDLSRVLEDLDHDLIGLYLRGQISSADMLMLTKHDLVDTDTVAKVTAALSELAPGVPIISTDTVASAAGILGLASRRPGGLEQLPEPTLFDPHKVESVPLPEPATEANITKLLDELPSAVVRAKGIAQTAQGELLLVQKVGTRTSIGPLPNAEWQLPTDLVVISLPVRDTPTKAT